MRGLPIVAGLVLALAGAVWLAQGLNLPFALGSFMSADPTWAVIGALTLAGGLALAGWGWRRARS